MRMRALLAVGLGALVAAAPAAAEPGVPEIRVLSSRADLVSGGDALVAIDLAGARRGGARVRLNGHPARARFQRRGGRLVGLVRGLRRGRNSLVVRTAQGTGARLVITNHAFGGPMLSGPQIQPWVCTTERHGLGPPRGPKCHAPVRYRYYYVPAGLESQKALSVLRPYDPADPPDPGSISRTTTDQGDRVPFIVRQEIGVANRGIYNLAVLHDPSLPPSAPPPAWTGKLYWNFGGDCKPNHVQPAPSDTLGGATDNLNAAVLGRGFVVGVSGMTVLGANCNPVVAAETLMMLKERVVERYGPIRYTFSQGGSGGSMQQHFIVSAYPGLLNGIQPALSFPDFLETLQEAEDCHLLDRYFLHTAPERWLVLPQQEAVSGYALPTTCRTLWDNPFNGYSRVWLDPAYAEGCGLPPEEVYDPDSNPAGVRCTLPDYLVNILGRHEADGFGLPLYDNVGVRYGLRALRRGLISAEQFVDLNERIGGLDIDWRWQPQRSTADLSAIRAAYRSGLVVNPRAARRVPILDIRGHSNLEIHTDFHSNVTRARLDRATGGHLNQVIWVGAIPLAGEASQGNLNLATLNVSQLGYWGQAFSLMDEWLARIEADRSDRGRAAKVLDAKPAAAVDACWSGLGQRITARGVCDTMFPRFADPRLAAGAPPTDDVLKCSLRPLDRSDYPVAFTADQWVRLGAAFPAGVCDYSRPSAGWRPSVPWLSYADGPGGSPLGPPPHSQPLR